MAALNKLGGARVVLSTVTSSPAISRRDRWHWRWWQAGRRWRFDGGDPGFTDAIDRRELLHPGPRAHGHDVRLMSPEYVRPYVKAQKNDDRDAEGIAEAATRPTMRFVEVKSEAQRDMQTLHRSRDRLVGERTALINQLRAILLERGLVVPQGKRKLEQIGQRSDR